MSELPSYVYYEFPENIEDRISYGEYHPERTAFFKLLDEAVKKKGYDLYRVHEISIPVEDKVKPNRDFSNEVFSFLGLRNMESDTGKAMFQEIVGNDILSASNRFFKGNLVFAGLRPYLNKVHHIKIKEGIGSAELFVIEPIHRIVIPTYLLEYLLCDITLTQTKWILTGCSYPRLDPEDFANLRIICPDKTVQKKLVSEIKSLRQELETSEKRMERLTDCFNSLVPSKLNISIPPDSQVDYYTLFPDAAIERVDFIWNSPWMVKIDHLLRANGATSLKQHIKNKIQSGVSTSGQENGDIPIINIENLKRDGRIHKENILYVDEANQSKLLSYNDLLISRTRDAGICVLVTKEEEGFTFSQNVLHFKLKQEINNLSPEYLVSFLNSTLGQAQIRRWESGSAGKNINTKKIPKFNLILPNSPRLMNEITETIHTIWIEMKKLDEEINIKMAEIRSFLPNHLLK